jgi:two-component system, sensor histidine kinase and response regulator
MSKILLVEDDPQISELYRIKLTNLGFDFSHAPHGLLGLKAVEADVPDIILLDLRMPVMDGETFLRLLRKNEAWVDIPVIILTNISKSEAPQTIWHYGISGYIIKAHSTPSEIGALVQKTLHDK